MNQLRKKWNEWISIQITKNPGRMVLGAILLFNVLFFVLSAFVISRMSVSGTEQMGFLEAAFCTVTMILDAGCIQFVIADIGQSGVALVVVCLAIIVIGMISFTGAVIGYVTNFISGFIENANSGSKKLTISDHVVILNWNSRASEIVNDLLYCDTKQKVVVLTGANRTEIQKEIRERLEDTITRENKALLEECENRSFFQRFWFLLQHRFRNNIMLIVREGDIFSSKQLHDISLERAKTVIILGNDINNSICKFEYKEKLEDLSKGNAQTVKTLMQVADITAAATSADNQKIIVEITDDWTDDLVAKIIKCKQVDGKCNIVPIRINKILGQILSQFSLMPELNLVYKELFSNKGATFYSKEELNSDNDSFIQGYLSGHRHAIPLTTMSYKGKNYGYYSANSEKSIDRISALEHTTSSVKLNLNYWIEKKNVIILGHNSKSKDIMQGFAAFQNEWAYQNSTEEILNIVVIDNEKNLAKMDYYRDYPFVRETVCAEIYDRAVICDAIDRVLSQSSEDVSILILSDDAVLNEDIDASALANLVYVQDIVNAKVAENPDFDVESIDVVVEIIDPKHHDIVNSYSVNNVVISNRYISKMITQIGEKEAMFDFYSDILTYDEAGVQTYESKEVYVKKVSSYFDEIPKKCTAQELIRAVYQESVSHKETSPAILLGYVKPGGKLCLFEGNQNKMMVELEEKDKIIVFSNH